MRICRRTGERFAFEFIQRFLARNARHDVWRIFVLDQAEIFELHSEITPRQILKLDFGPMTRNGVTVAGLLLPRDMTGSLQLRDYPSELVRLSCEKCGRAGKPTLSRAKRTPRAASSTNIGNGRHHGRA